MRRITITLRGGKELAFTKSEKVSDSALLLYVKPNNQVVEGPIDHTVAWLGQDVLCIEDEEVWLGSKTPGQSPR